MENDAQLWAIGSDVELFGGAFDPTREATVIRVVDGQMQLRLRDGTPVGPIEAGSSVGVRQTLDNGVVQAETTITQDLTPAGSHVLLAEPVQVRRDQRRGLFRMPTALPITLQIKKAHRQDWISRRVYHHLTADASGSGCAIETELPLERGDRVRVTVWPDRPTAVIAGAMVAWSGPSDWPGLKRVGLSFTTISTTGQDRLVGTLLEEERVRRRVFAES